MWNSSITDIMETNSGCSEIDEQTLTIYIGSGTFDHINETIDRST